MNTQINEYGYVIDLELAKDILIEYFSSGRYQYCTGLEELRNKIRNNLIEYGGGYSFRDENGTYFGGPDGMSGYVICELYGWIKENNPPSTYGIVRDLNNKKKVFFLLYSKKKAIFAQKFEYERKY